MGPFADLHSSLVTLEEFFRGEPSVTRNVAQLAYEVVRARLHEPAKAQNSDIAEAFAITTAIELALRTGDSLLGAGACRRIRELVGVPHPE